MVSYTLSSIFDSSPYLSITITSRDIKRNKNNTNNTIVIFRLKGGVSGVISSVNI
jgi:hypothetical protein